MCFEEIKRRARITRPILDSIIINMIVGTYMMTIVMSIRISTLTTNETFIRAPKFMRKVATASIWIRRFHILGEVA
jgi:hypothetical protein